MKIFVTGGTGYLGRALTIALTEQGYHVHLLARDPENIDSFNSNRIKVFKGDLLNPKSIEKAMTGCDFVFHLAAFTDLRCETVGPFHDVNVLGTLNMLKAAKQLEIKRFVFTSSLSVYGPSNGKGPINEKQPRVCSYKNDYELTKAMAEELVLKENSENFQTLVLNVSRIYGPGVKNFSNGVNKFIEMIKTKKNLIFPNKLKVTANYVFIDNVVHAHVNCIHYGNSGEKYIVGGVNCSYKKLIKSIKQVSKSPCKIITLNYTVVQKTIEVYSFVSHLLRIPNKLTPTILDSLFTNRIATSRKAVKELHYEVTSLEQGLRKTLASM